MASGQWARAYPLPPEGWWGHPFQGCPPSDQLAPYRGAGVQYLSRLWEGEAKTSCPQVCDFSFHICFSPLNSLKRPSMMLFQSCDTVAWSGSFADRNWIESIKVLFQASRRVALTDGQPSESSKANGHLASSNGRFQQPCNTLARASCVRGQGTV